VIEARIPEIVTDDWVIRRRGEVVLGLMTSPRPPVNHKFAVTVFKVSAEMYASKPVGNILP
jgi:hypothetical protein